MTVKKQLKADAGLLMITVGWGASFILTKMALSFLPTYNFLAVRFILAFFISAAVFFKRIRAVRLETIKAAAVLGLILFLHYAFQTVGLNYTTPAKSAFITGVNVILVPVLSSLLVKQRPSRKIIISTVIAFAGLGLLTLNQSINTINIGDIYTLLCAVMFAVYIIFVGKYTVKVDSISLAVLQLAIVGLLSLICSLIVENPVMPAERSVWLYIVILSVFCTSGAYIVQSVAQRYTSSAHTALIYTTEPVFAAIFGYIIAGELLSTRGILGGVLILTGMLLAEIDKPLLQTGKLARIIFPYFFRGPEAPGGDNSLDG